MNEAERTDMTEFQAQLASEKESALRKYAGITVGDGGLWPLLRYEAAAWLLAPMPGALGYAFRGKLYPRLLRSCGGGLVVGRNVTLRHPGRISLGRGVIVDDNCVLDAKGESEDGISIGDGVVISRNTIVSCKGGSIRIGDHSNVSANCIIISETKLDIGRNVLIAGLAYIIAGGNHGTDRTDIPIIRQPMVQRGGVKIEDNCWLGANVTVLDGVTVGRDSIIGAGAVVTENIPEFSVALGVPAKVVKHR